MMNSKKAKKAVCSSAVLRRQARNLTKGVPHQWRKGQSGNPGGRPKYAELSRACRGILSEPVPGNDDDLTYAEAIALRLATAALAGSVAAAQELADRAEGRARQSLDLTGDRPDPLAAVLEELRAQSKIIGPPEGAMPIH